MMVQNPYEYFPDAQRKLHEAIAAEVEQGPEMLDGALQNIERWLQGGHEAEKRLLQWKTLIDNAKASEAGKRKLMEILLDQSEAATHLKSFSPFAGLLDIEKRRQILFS